MWSLLVLLFEKSELWVKLMLLKPRLEGSVIGSGLGDPGMVLVPFTVVSNDTVGLQPAARSALRNDEYDRFLLMDGFDPQRARPASFSPPPTVARQGVAVAFTEAPELHPALDSGTVASWIGVGRPGRTLVGLLHALLRRAVEEERDHEGREPTPF